MTLEKPEHRKDQPSYRHIRNMYKTKRCKICLSDLTYKSELRLAKMLICSTNSTNHFCSYKCLLKFIKIDIKRGNELL